RAARGMETEGLEIHGHTDAFELLANRLRKPLLRVRMREGDREPFATSLAREARLVEPSFRDCGVVRVLPDIRRVGPRQQMADRSCRGSALTEVAAIDDERPIERGHDRAAYSHIAKRRSREVRYQNILTNRASRPARAGDHRDSLGVPQTLQVRTGDAADVVDLTFLQRGD